MNAHRFSYVLHNGPVPEDMVVMHLCDTPLCVNPEHLRLGTQKDNLQDMYSKRRNRSIETYAQQSGNKHWTKRVQYATS